LASHTNAHALRFVLSARVRETSFAHPPGSRIALIAAQQLVIRSPRAASVWLISNVPLPKAIRASILRPVSWFRRRHARFANFGIEGH